MYVWVYISYAYYELLSIERVVNSESCVFVVLRLTLWEGSHPWHMKLHKMILVLEMMIYIFCELSQMTGRDL